MKRIFRKVAIGALLAVPLIFATTGLASANCGGCGGGCGYPDGLVPYCGGGSHWSWSDCRCKGGTGRHHCHHHHHHH